MAEKSLPVAAAFAGVIAAASPGMSAAKPVVGFPVIKKVVSGTEVGRIPEVVQKLQERYNQCVGKGRLRDRFAEKGCVFGVGHADDLGHGDISTLAELGVKLNPDGSADVINRSRVATQGHAQRWEKSTGGWFKAESYKDNGLYVVEAVHLSADGRVTPLDPNTYPLDSFGLAGGSLHKYPFAYQARKPEVNPTPVPDIGSGTRTSPTPQPGQKPSPPPAPLRPTAPGPGNYKI